MSAVPPVTSSTHTKYDQDDIATCCCFGRKIKKQEPKPAPLTRGFASRQLDLPVRDASQIFALDTIVYPDGTERKHTRQVTQYPRDGIDADSTQSTVEEKK